MILFPLEQLMEERLPSFGFRLGPKMCGRDALHDVFVPRPVELIAAYNGDNDGDEERAVEALIAQGKGDEQDQIRLAEHDFPLFRRRTSNVNTFHLTYTVDLTEQDHVSHTEAEVAMLVARKCVGTELVQLRTADDVVLGGVLTDHTQKRTGFEDAYFDADRLPETHHSLMSKEVLTHTMQNLHRVLEGDVERAYLGIGFLAFFCKKLLS